MAITEFVRNNTAIFVVGALLAAFGAWFWLSHYTPPSQDNPIRELRILEDEWLVTDDGLGGVKVWQLPELNVVFTARLDAPTRGGDLVWPDLGTILLVRSTGHVYGLDLSAGDSVFGRSVTARERVIALSPDGQQLVVLSAGRHLRVIDVRSRKRLASFDLLAEYHALNASSPRPKLRRIDPHGEFMLLEFEGRTPMLYRFGWDALRPLIVDGGIDEYVWSHDGTRIAVRHNGAVTLFRNGKNQTFVSRHVPAADMPPPDFRLAGLYPEQGTLVFANAKGIEVRDLINSSLREAIDFDEALAEIRKRARAGDRARSADSYSWTLSSNGRWLAFSPNDLLGDLAVIELASNRQSNSWGRLIAANGREAERPVAAIEFQRRGRMFVAHGKRLDTVASDATERRPVPAENLRPARDAPNQPRLDGLDWLSLAFAIFIAWVVARVVTDRLPLLVSKGLVSRSMLIQFHSMKAGFFAFIPIAIGLLCLTIWATGHDAGGGIMSPFMGMMFLTLMVAAAMFGVVAIAGFGANVGVSVGQALRFDQRSMFVSIFCCTLAALLIVPLFLSPYELGLQEIR